MYVAKTDWQNHIDTILASGQPITAALLRQFHTDMLDSWVHLDDAGGGSSSTLYPMVAYVNGDNGDDATAVVGDINLPYSTIEAAVAAVSGTWPLVIVYPCSSGYDVSATITKSTSIRIYFMPGTRVTTSITGPLFEVDGNNYFNILGYGRFGHFGAGDIYLDEGQQTLGINIFEFDECSASTGKCINVTDGAGASNGKLLIIKGNSCTSSGSQAINCEGFRTYRIDVNNIYSSNSYAARFYFTNAVSLDMKSLVAMSNTTSAIYYYFDVATSANFDIKKAIGNFFAGFSYEFNSTGSPGPASINIINGYESCTISSNGYIYLKTFGANIFAAELGTDTIAFFEVVYLLVATGSDCIVYAKMFASADIDDNARLILIGDLIIFNDGKPIVSLADGGRFSLHGSIENIGNNDCIECDGTDTYLDIMPGSRIKTTSGNFPINIISGTCHYKALGPHFVNLAINGTPTFEVGSGADLIVNSNI